MQHDVAERLAALIIVGGGLLFVVGSFRRYSGRPGESVRRALRVEPTDARASQLCWLAAASCSVGAAIIHVALAPEHVAELGSLGIGFLVAGALQAGMALPIAIRRTEQVAWTAICLNVVLIGAWAWSRTVGLPVGDDPWHPEAIGRADVITVALEAAIVLPLLAWIRGRRLGRPDLRSAYASITVVPAIGMVVVLTILALAGPGEGHQHAVPASFVDRMQGSPGGAVLDTRR